MEKRTKKILNFLVFSSIIGLSSFTISCTNPGDYRNEKQYVKIFNQPNFLKTNDYSFNNNKIIDNDSLALVFAPLITYEYSDKLVLDHVNNAVAVPTKKSLKLNLIDYIKVELENDTFQLYNSDDSDFSLTKPDLFTNYSKNIIELTSLNTLSVNHKNFFDNIKKSKQISIKLKDLVYTDYKGNATNFKLNPKDFLTSLNKLTNKDSFNNLKLLYGVDFVVENDLLIIKNNAKKLDLFLKDQLMKNMMFNPTSNEYLSTLNLDVDQYQPKLQEAIYLSDYILNSNTLEKQIFNKNLNGANSKFIDDNSRIEQVILNFNSVPIDNETFRLQSFKSFRQNLLNESDFDIFNSDQKNEIENFSRAYGLTMQLQDSSLKSNVNSIYNINFSKNKKFDFNDNYSKLLYGTDTNELINEKNDEYFYSDKNSKLFRSYLANAINLSAINEFSKKANYWNNLALPNMILDGKDAINSTYKNANDAALWINNNLIFSYNFKKNITTNFITENNKLNSLSSFIDNNEKLKSSAFDFIKENINNLLDNFYTTNDLNNEEKIEFVLPIFAEENDLNKILISNTENLLNSLDNRLKSKLILVQKDYNSKFNSSVIYQEFIYSSNKIDSYLELILKNQNLLKSIYFYKDKEFKYLIKLSEILNKYQLDKLFNNRLLNEQLFKESLEFMHSLNNFEQVELVNQIGLNNPIPITLNLYNNFETYKKIIVKNNIEKPLNDLGYNRFQDIKVF
ncbi:OppA family ABC transporter substrate-binding lipoprotein [Mycoplasmopsis alligatoris]|uniref:Lipoprotein n=1 Tax=Mycoplasmopsis alligatoris A21JP2 TaxID=747682 RepID=D4XV28_9BACT|nr:hypothetical protein [Mycoplasmopsis alligatoris]EFF41815.1 hypothetical protein MALL_0189 [Mycoplasmopsis alligatoris A21JP2]